MDLIAMLKEVDELEASDLYLISGAVPAIALNSRLVPAKSCAGLRLSAQQAEVFGRQMTTPEQWDELQRRRELNVAFAAPGVSRFRVNLLWQRGALGMVMRRVVENIPTLRRLGLPPVLREVALAERGIVLVTGATGTGKSTTMASMIDYRNHLLTGHIITIEDPIEFLYHHRRSIVTQREIGMDTLSFDDALKNSLRQAPNVLMIGEMRDAETVRFALHAAETGHVVFATLHSTNAVLAVKRVLNFFPDEMHPRLLSQLASNLVAIISQRLVRGKNGGRVCAAEVLLATPRTVDLIERGDTDKLREYLNSESHEGAQSFDLMLYRLVKRGLINEEDALQNANSTNDLSLKFKGVGIQPGTSWDNLEDQWKGITEEYVFPENYKGRPGDMQAESYTNEGAKLSGGQAPPSRQAPRTPAPQDHVTTGPLRMDEVAAALAAAQAAPHPPRPASNAPTPDPRTQTGQRPAMNPAGPPAPPKQPSLAPGELRSSSQRPMLSLSDVKPGPRSGEVRRPADSGMPPSVDRVRASGTSPKPDLGKPQGEAELDELD